MAELQFDDKNVAFQNGENALVFAVMKTTKPYKPFALQPERDKSGKETGWYTVPKSLVFAYRSERLADGSRMSVNRTKPVVRTEREALLAAGIAKGLKVRPLEAERAERERPVALTLETLIGDTTAKL